MAIAGSIVKREHVQILPHANLNTNVLHVGKNMHQKLVQNSTKITTPIKVDNLKPLLDKYNMEATDKIVSGFEVGFRLGSEQTCFSIDTPKNHSSALNQSKIVSEKNETEIKLGTYKGPFRTPPLNYFVTSPLGMIPKKEIGTFRVIHDLSFTKTDSVNFHIPP